MYKIKVIKVGPHFFHTKMFNKIYKKVFITMFQSPDCHTTSTSLSRNTVN